MTYDIPFDSMCIQGCSTKALIILGAVQYLYDTKKLALINNFVGTSSGAIVSFMLIIGYTPAEILCYICVNQVMEKLTNFNLVSMVNGLGAKSWSRIQEILEKMTIQKIGYLPTMKCIKEKFKKNLTMVTYNLTTKKTEYISSETHPDLPVLVAIRMTANLPFVFEKFQYQGQFFIDGGLSNNFPLTYAEEQGKKVIAIRISNDSTSEKCDTSFVSYLSKIMMIPIIEVERAQIESCKKSTVVCELKTDKFVSCIDFKFTNTQKMDMFSAGYQQMRNYFEPTEEAEKPTEEAEKPKEEAEKPKEEAEKPKEEAEKPKEEEEEKEEKEEEEEKVEKEGK